MSLTDSAPISRMVRYQVPRLLVSPRRRAIMLWRTSMPRRRSLMVSSLNVSSNSIWVIVGWIVLTQNSMLFCSLLE